jgi:transcriptional regulator with XRE-family HTH domain
MVQTDHRRTGGDRVTDQTPTAYKLQLGATLERLRISVGKDREDAAEVLQCSPSKIGRIERGDVGVRPLELRALLDFYGVKEEDRADIEELGRAAQRRRARTPYGSVIPDKFRRFFHLEETAVELQSYDPELVHGLAQTEAYARAVTVANPLHRPQDIDRLIQARLARQARLTAPNPPRLWLVLSEGAIRREVGGADVMREQLKHLVKLGKRPNITIQVVPFSAGAHAATGFPFTVLVRGAAGPSIVYLENVTDASFVDDPDRVANYELVFRQTLTSALTSSASADLLATLAKEL